MKKFLSVFLILGFLGWPLFAAEFKGNESVLVSRGDTVQADLFGASRFITVDGVVEGDVIGACEIFRVNGRVGDNVIAASRVLLISGTVDDVVIAFGQTIQISGQVNGDVVAFCKEIQILPDAHIKGSLYIGTGNLMLDGGVVEGDINGGAGRAFLNGPVGGRTELEVKEIRFGEKYRAGKGTKLTLPHPLKREKYRNLPENLEVVVKKRPLFFLRFSFYWKILALFITGLLVYLFFKTPVNEYLDGLRQDFGKKLLTGFLAFIALPVAALLLLILVFTLPVGFILGAVYLILLVLGYVFGALAVGEYLVSTFRREGSSRQVLLSLALGVLVVVLLIKLPYIGWLLKLLVIWFGMGGLLNYFWRFNKTIREQQQA